MLKDDVSNGFYRIFLRPANAPKLGLVFPVDDGAKPLVAIFLTLPMGWNNSPLLFCTAIETVPDLSNHTHCSHSPLWPHKLDGREATVLSAALLALDPTLVPLSQNIPLLRTNA